VGYNALRKKARMEERHPGAAHNQPEDVPLASQSPAPEADAEEAIAMSVKECARTLHAIESRLRHVEAFITSRKFRLHCEINRI